MADDHVRLTREQYAQLWGNAQKGVFSQEVFDRAEQMKISDELRGIIKKTHPNVPQSGYDEKTEFNKRFDAFEKAQKDKEEAAKVKAEDDSWTDRMNRVRDDYRLDDKGMEALDTFMRAEKVANPEIAAAEMHRRNPPMSEVSNGGGYYMNFQKQDDWDAVAKNPEKWAHDLIYKAALKQEQKEKNRRF